MRRNAEFKYEREIRMGCNIHAQKENYWAICVGRGAINAAYRPFRIILPLLKMAKSPNALMFYILNNKPQILV